MQKFQNRYSKCEWFANRRLVTSEDKKTHTTLGPGELKKMFNANEYTYISYWQIIWWLAYIKAYSDSELSNGETKYFGFL